MKPEQNTINKISPHLFWDVDISKLDLLKDKKFIVKRVLEYGLEKDWELLLQLYGIDEIGRAASSINDLDKKSAFFISALTDIDIFEFKCFTTTQSVPPHWNF